MRLSRAVHTPVIQYFAASLSFSGRQSHCRLPVAPQRKPNRCHGVGTGRQLLPARSNTAGVRRRRRPRRTSRLTARSTTITTPPEQPQATRACSCPLAPDTRGVCRDFGTRRGALHLIESVSACDGYTRAVPDRRRAIGTRRSASFVTAPRPADDRGEVLNCYHLLPGQQRQRHRLWVGQRNTVERIEQDRQPRDLPLRKPPERVTHRNHFVSALAPVGDQSAVSSPTSTAALLDNRHRGCH
jgi:hypothetical protein